MAIEPQYESITLKKEKTVLTDKIKAECKTDLISDETGKILCVRSKIFDLKKEVENGKIKYGGKIVFYSFYQDAENNIMKKECANEFSGVLPCELEDGEDVKLYLDTTKCETDRTGSYVFFSTLICVTAVVVKTETADMFTGGEGLICKKEEKEIYKTFGTCSSNYPFEEEFEVGYSIKEVLTHKAEAFITDVQCGVGSIIVDGDIYLSALLLPNTEKCDIIRENKILKFRAEIECEESMPTMLASAEVSVKSFKTDISVDDENNKSTVAVSVLLSVTGEAYGMQAISLSSDVFSTKEELEIERAECEVITPTERSLSTEKVIGRAGIPELNEGVKIVAVYEEKAEILSISGEQEKEASGVLYLTAFCVDGEGKYFPVRAESEIKFALKTSEYSEVSVFAQNAQAKIISQTEIETETELVIVYSKKEKKKTDYIKDVKSLGEKKTEDYAISVYIPEKGEELWSLSKRLNVCPEELLETNKELQFPLNGDERIIIYRQK